MTVRSRVERWRGTSRFHLPLIEPDGRFSRIRLSDKDDVTQMCSRLGTRMTRKCEPSFAVACNALRNAWTSSGGRLAPVARSLVASCVVLELRLLHSTGITRLPRYYEPLRHPSRPSRTLAGVSLTVTRRHRGGFLCCVGLLSQTCHRHYPGGPTGSCHSVLFRPGQRHTRLSRRPSPLVWRVGVHIALFEACSTFTRVTACLFAELLNNPFHRRLRRFRFLHRRSDCYRRERPVAGWNLNPLKTNTFHSAHTNQH